MKLSAVVPGLVAGFLAWLPSAQAADVTLVTDFGFNGRHSYFYVALDKGYYRQENLDVTILRGQGSADAIKKVASGAATIGFADAGAVVLARGNDKIPVKMVAVVYATPPQAIMTLASSQIRTPKDLEGKTIADTPSSSVRLLFPAYAEAAGIDGAKVTWVNADSAALPSVLATRRAEGIGQFTVGEPLIAKATAPQAVTVLAYKDAGLNFYGNGLVASESTLASRPDQVRGFVRATLRGMRDAFADPAGAAAIMSKHHKQIDPTVIEAETRLVKDLAVQPGMPLGKIDPARMEQTVRVVSKYFTLATPVTPAEVAAEGFVE
ncbi:ABC transporter substrate-binding protein [Methylobacterium terricola]|uniref:ABC transporter substrate-binding protein n=1 Tax=Methylobacterium terricola TaxID=2583531 RepID=A0A5C4L864_9HYPH|nr:ABC transporter substrate-binding protein [Methylobacterium terricola]TNC08343.1 ABC transporter substrate-binding protein [Methylobacterium terricola]